MGRKVNKINTCRALTVKSTRAYCLTAFVLSFFSLLLSAQDIKVSARLDSNFIRIGEQTQIQLTFTYSADKGDVKVVWPTLKDTIIDKVEIVHVSKIDTTIPDKSNLVHFVQTQNITITSFDSGFYALPPFKFIVNGDTSHPYETEAMLFQVNNVQVDTTQAIKDIKPPLHEPFSWRELIPYAYWTIGIIAAILGLVYLFKRLSKIKPKEILKPKSKTPPHITALQELEKLRNEKLWQDGRFKQYHSRLTDIIRFYIEGRFSIQAMEQTSDEILSSFRTIVVDEQSKLRLKKIFQLADLVKFAKEQPVPNENESAIADAFDFVNGTSREETKASADSSVNNTDKSQVKSENNNTNAN